MKWVPLTGVAFVVLAILSIAIGGGEPPDAKEPVQKIVDHYSDNKDAIQISALLAALAGVLLIFFAGYLRKVLQAAEGANGFLSALVLTGAAIMAVGLTIDQTISFALAEAADKIDPTAVQALQALWDNDFLPIAMGTIVFLLSTGLSIVIHGALPKWLGWVAILLAVLGATPAGFIAFVASALWIAVVSIMLKMRGEPAPA
jgi:hypothetical protein